MVVQGTRQQRADRLGSGVLESARAGVGWNDRDDAQSGDNWLAYAQDFGFFVLTGNNIDDYWRLIVEV